jgi:alpha-L-fucosidase
MMMENWPAAEYARLARKFKPARFDAGAWADLAVAAGMKYGVLITRHCDGYCLFDSAHSAGDFTSVRNGPGRDFVREYVEAFRKRGLKVGLYYSVGDWREPGYFDPEGSPASAARMVESVHRQVEELMTRYGTIDVLWYDGWYWEWCRTKWPGLPREKAIAFWRSHELNAMVRRHQPGIIINDRSGPPEDFTTPEQKVEAEKAGRAWETCMTIGSTNAWGYIRHDPNRKTASQLIKHLIEASYQGGNFLLDVGPKPDGTIRSEERARLLEMGDWLKANGESIYGGGLKPLGWYQTGRSASRGRTVYQYFYQWPGREAVVPDLATPVRSARLLGTGQPVTVRAGTNRRTFLSGLPARPPSPHASVVALECEGEPALIQDAQPCWWT